MQSNEPNPEGMIVFIRSRSIYEFQVLFDVWNPENLLTIGT